MCHMTFTSLFSCLSSRMLIMEQDHQRALESHDQDLRALQRKTESNIEFMKQEHNIAQAKVGRTSQGLGI